jgi:hypothetical protein
MKKWFLLFAVLSPIGALAQAAAISNYCVNGATPATTSGPASSNYLQGIIQQCTVTAYLTGGTAKSEEDIL